MLMTEKNINFYWSRGFQLSKAFHQLATKEQKTKYEELSRAVSLSSMVPRFQAYAEQSKENPPEEFWKGVQSANVLGPTSEHSNLVDQLKTQTRTWIRTGKLRVFGFAKPRQPTDKPIEVPADLWNGFLSWDKEYIEGNGLRIEGLRAIPAHWLQKESKRPGRPTRVPEIMRAYLELKQAQKIDFTQPIKTIALQVRAHILSRPGVTDESGLGGLAVQRAIGDDVRAEKSRISKI